MYLLVYLRIHGFCTIVLCNNRQLSQAEQRVECERLNGLISTRFWAAVKKAMSTLAAVLASAVGRRDRDRASQKG